MLLHVFLFGFFVQLKEALVEKFESIEKENNISIILNVVEDPLSSDKWVES
jgi:hypothetical protein